MASEATTTNAGTGTAAPAQPVRTRAENRRLGLTPTGRPKRAPLTGEAKARQMANWKKAQDALKAKRAAGKPGTPKPADTAPETTMTKNTAPSTGRRAKANAVPPVKNAGTPPAPMLEVKLRTREWFDYILPNKKGEGFLGLFPRAISESKE